MPAIIAVIVRYVVYLGAMGIGALGTSLWHTFSIRYAQKRKEQAERHRAEMLQKKR